MDLAVVGLIVVLVLLAGGWGVVSVVAEGSLGLPGRLAWIVLIILLPVVGLLLWLLAGTRGRGVPA